MPIGIADVKKERVGYAMTAGAALHVGKIARRRHYVANVDDVEDVGIPQSDMMQARADTVGEGEIVDVALAVHPYGPELGVGVVGLGIFGEPEAELAIEIVALLHVGREAIEMVDALNAGAKMVAILLQHAGGLVHLHVKIERHPERIGGAQRAPLMRQIRERCRQVAAIEPERGAVEVLLAGKLKAERPDIRLRRLP